MKDETTAALSPTARAKLGAAIKTILDELDDVDRESTADTPNRVMQIARSISDGVNALGVGVVIQGSHMCAGMRGALKPNAKMVTSAMLGTFRTESKTRKEFLANINPVLAHA